MIKHISQGQIPKRFAQQENENRPCKCQTFQIEVNQHKSRQQIKDSLLVTPSKIESDEQNYYQYKTQDIRFGAKCKEIYLKNIHTVKENVQIDHCNPLTPYVSPSFQLTSSIQIDKLPPQNLLSKNKCCLYLQQKYIQEIKYLTMNNQQLYQQVQLLSNQVKQLANNITELKISNKTLSTNNEILRTKTKRMAKSFQEIKGKYLKNEKQSLKEKQCLIADNFKEIQIIQKIAFSHKKYKECKGQDTPAEITNKKYVKRAKTQYYEKKDKESQCILPLLTWQDTQEVKIHPTKKHQKTDIVDILAKTKFTETDVTNKESLKFSLHKNLSKYSPKILEKEITKLVGKLSKQKNIILKEIIYNQNDSKLKPQKNRSIKNKSVKQKLTWKVNGDKYTSFFAGTSTSNANKHK